MFVFVYYYASYYRLKGVLLKRSAELEKTLTGLFRINFYGNSSRTESSKIMLLVIISRDGSQSGRMPKLQFDYQDCLPDFKFILTP